MVHNVNSGHPDHLVVLNEFIALYQNLIVKKVLIWMELEDLFFLSNGHISPVFIAF
jgi:hypothetical protein